MLPSFACLYHCHTTPLNFLHNANFTCFPSGPSGKDGKEPTCQCRRCKRLEFDPWVGKMPWSRKWQLTAVFLPAKFQEQRNLVGYSPWDCKESNVTEHTCRADQTVSKMHTGMVCVCVCVCPRRGELGSPCSLWHRNKKLPKAHSHTKLLTPMAQPFITDLLSLFRQDILKMSWPLPTAPPDTSKHSELEKKCQVLVKWVTPHTSNKAFSAENLLRCLSKSFAIQKAR